MFRKKCSKWGEQGQTAVEYLLMLVVVVSMAVGVFGQLKAFFLADTGKCEGPKAKKAVICQIKKLMSEDSGYRYFSLMAN